MIKIGQKNTSFIKITKSHIEKFRTLTGDNNPIHLNKKFAQKHGFDKPIAYGLLTSSFLSKIIGSKLPGSGAVWTNCNLRFNKPVFVDDKLKIELTISQISLSLKMVKVTIEIFNQDGEIVLDGISDIKVPSYKLPQKRKNNIKKKIKTDNRKGDILVLGGSSSIGSEIIKKIYKKESIIYTYFKNKLKLKETKKLKSLHLDLSKKQNIDKFLKKLKTKTKKLKGIVFLASDKLAIKEFSSTPLSKFFKDFQISVGGFVQILKSVDNMFIPNKSFIIVLSSDSVNDLPPIYQSSYVVSKSALSALGKSLAVEYSKKGIKVNIIEPGMIDTKFTDKIPEIAKETYKTQNLSGELVQKSDVVNFIKYLIKNDLKNNFGTTYRINNGKK